ncbi:MAG: 2-phospho-L-lactate guanylyltransferase, partial [Dactylosporangium sp.]|nr:2-phospho-L-lactate guanylyltransferase [Dactylosporangium sp.]NNJ60623.1 2-phospho-L-lactate guanylyltransferase [Dactylosporangium sp.]
MVDLWNAVIALKPPDRAKLRLRGVLPGSGHRALVVAMALDTVAATLACRLVGSVVLVCDEVEVRTAAAALGARCLPDTPAAGLNAALV